jgi:hypothetical protein
LSIAEEFLERDIIFLLMEDLIPSVPAIDHMIKHASRGGPSCSWHRESIHKTIDSVQRKVECPLFFPSPFLSLLFSLFAKLPTSPPTAALRHNEWRAREVA